jgi:hypothetical protein
MLNLLSREASVGMLFTKATHGEKSLESPAGEDALLASIQQGWHRGTLLGTPGGQAL